MVGFEQPFTFTSGSKKPATVITLTTDASHSLWVVVCDGVISNGLWSSEEQAMHINWLELSGFRFGVNFFFHSHNCFFKVFCHSSTAVTYTNNLGEVVFSHHKVSKSIWEWYFGYHCMLVAFHIPSTSNFQGDSFHQKYN